SAKVSPVHRAPFSPALARRIVQGSGRTLGRRRSDLHVSGTDPGCGPQNEAHPLRPRPSETQALQTMSARPGETRVVTARDDGTGLAEAHFRPTKRSRRTR